MLNGQTFVYVYDGIIKADIEMNEVEIEPTILEDTLQSITIAMSEAKITRHEINDPQIIYESKDLLNSKGLDNYNDTIVEGKMKKRKNLSKMDI